jgi:stage II sporulation protein D
VKIIRAGSGYLDRMTHEHALLLTCACAAILFLGFHFPTGGWASLGLGFEEAGSPNSKLETEIDSALQEAATAALGQRGGTIIVVDPQSGRVRAIVNPQQASTQAVMPGSTIKPFTTLAALQAGMIEKDSRSVCPGRFTGLSFSLPCVHANHLPPFTPSQAIAYSCNYYFATLGQRLGRERLVETLRGFGFGQSSGLNEDVAGTLRPCETGNSARIHAESNHSSRQGDCAARAAIGESDHIQVTPIQLLMAYTALVNGGHLFQPSLPGEGQLEKPERATIEISPQHRAIITEGMAGAVRYGTARRARLDSLPLYILGKTGTSPPAKGFRTNGWFVGFAGPSKPTGELAPSEIGLAVLVLLERSHGSDAAALSKSIFAAYANIVPRNLSGRELNEALPVTTTVNRSTGSPTSNSKSRVKIHLVTENLTTEQSLEDYVLGVMRAEGSTESEPEALKALAIAIRSYAVKNGGRHGKDGYDFCSTTHCQRFVRGDGSQAMVNAVTGTSGQVLTDDRGQPVDMYFGASCGGETANIGTLWGTTPPEYLRGVRDEYCPSGPHANWTDVIPRADLLRALQTDARTDVGVRIDQVKVTRRDESNRAEFISLEGEHRKSVRGWDFKIIVGRALGWHLLKSSRFEVSRSGSNFIFRGSGFGHGLGLCQEGAHVMAARGASHQRILEKYLPGTIVKKRDLVAGNLNGSFDDQTNRVWKADALLGTPGLNQVVANSSQPRSGEMFIAPNLVMTGALRRSAMFSTTAPGRYAPPELVNSWNPRGYKHFVPTGLKTGPRYITISSEHFRVTYPADVDRRDANQVLSTLETARIDFLRRTTAASIALGGLPNLEIRLNESTGDFTARTGQPWWTAAATRGNRIELQPVGLLKRRGILQTTLRHEFAHVVINVVSRDRAPRWLEEGFALFLAGEGPAISAYQRRGTLTTDELEKRLERPGTQQNMRALYADAYRIVFSLIKTDGEASVWKKLAGS